MAKTERHFLGQEIKVFLRSELVKSYPHHFFPDEDRIVFEKLTFVGVYDLWDRSFGYFTHEAVNEIRAFVISEELVHLSQEKLNKILEIIKDGEGEGLNNFSLGDK
jgi:hypothetical protein